MLRVAVLLLAMLQQLMPPGMCLCVAVACAKAPPAKVEPPARSCGCCSHRKQPTRSEPEPAPRPCLPHCVTDAQQAVLADAVALLAVEVPEAVVPVDESVIAESRDDATPSHPPFYVTHCALLI